MRANGNGIPYHSRQCTECDADISTHTLRCVRLHVEKRPHTAGYCKLRKSTSSEGP